MATAPGLKCVDYFSATRFVSESVYGDALCSCLHSMGRDVIFPEYVNLFSPSTGNELTQRIHEKLFDFDKLSINDVQFSHKNSIPCIHSSGLKQKKTNKFFVNSHETFAKQEKQSNSFCLQHGQKIECFVEKSSLKAEDISSVKDFHTIESSDSECELLTINDKVSLLSPINKRKRASYEYFDDLERKRPFIDVEKMYKSANNLFVPIIS